ncbi:MAG: DUF3873 domain-containing protein [Odoribacteraceae bacterium]|jgi:hypothetical protein|nr:DUF3873 domain-containing protein [Odoribacteraceae bacterium]
METTTSINHGGCSTCQPGHENYATFKHPNGRTFYQYHYLPSGGDLFSCVSPTLDECRKQRDAWLARQAAGNSKTNFNS